MAKLRMHYVDPKEVLFSFDSQSITYLCEIFIFASCSIIIGEVREQSAFQFFSHILFFVSVELLNVGGDFVP